MKLADFKTTPLPIDTAPMDGTWIYTWDKDCEDPEIFKCQWDPSGDSWVDGKLEDTGFWLVSEEQHGGWFQPDEVLHWLPIDAI